MTHVFVSPHPDDAALSCGGLIAGLRDLGQAVTILTVFSGTGSSFSDTAPPAENLILFSHLEGRGAYANLPR